MADSFSHSTALAVSPEQAWPRLQDPETWSGVAGLRNLSDSSRDAQGVLEGFSFVVEAAGKRVKGTVKTIEHRSPEMLTVALDSTDLGGTITVDLASEDVGTTLTVRLSLKPVSFMVRLAFPVISQTIAKGLPPQVEALARRLERSEP